jgi:ribosomal protein S18 acetylase RimI-like enzyme
MELVPLTEDELSGYIRTAEKGYAEQKSSMGGMPAQEAIKQAEQETAQMFPQGRLQPGHEVLKLVDDSGTELGHIWLAPHQEPGLVFVYDVEVAPHVRGQGFGRALMQLAHERARSMGYHSISLHVFGGNQPAINLYSSLGYEVTNVSMRRSL